MNRRFSTAALLMAVLLSLLAGFAIARWFSSSTLANADSAATNTHVAGTDTDDHDDDDDHHDDDHQANVIELSPAQLTASAIEVVPVQRGGGQSSQISGRVEPMPGARAAVAALVSGRVQRVLVAPGDHVRAGDPIAVLLSGDGASLRAAADAAQAEAQAAASAYQRDSHLTQQGVVARQEMEASRARVQAAQANMRAAQARMAAAGHPDSRGRITIPSPVSGVVGAVGISAAGFVSAGDVVATVSNPSDTQLVFNTTAALAAQVSPGMALQVRGPQGSFAAQVIASATDIEQTGMAVIRAKASNTPLPATGAVVTAVMTTEQDQGIFSVPAEAVQSLDGRSVVFVSEPDGRFRAMPVMAGRRAGDQIEIITGLQGDERIAARNAFLLKAELSKGDADHDH